MIAVDVIIPAYNSASTVSAAVRSGLSVDGARVIVVDDGSTDETAALAARAGATVIHQANAGASRARARGLAESGAEYVIFLDADDEVIAGGVMSSMSILNSSPGVAVAAGRVVGARPSGSQNLLPRHYTEVTAQSLLDTGFGPWPPAAAVVRREALELSDKLEAPVLHTRFAEDYELIIRLSLVGEIAMHEEPAALYRLFDGKSSSSAERALRDKERIRRHYAGHLQLAVSAMTEREIRAASHLRNVKILWSQGRRFTAVRDLVRGGLADPRATFKKMRESRRLGAKLE